MVPTKAAAVVATVVVETARNNRELTKLELEGRR